MGLVKCISPRTSSGLHLLFLLIGLSAVPSLQAQARYTRALIHVCDKGTVPVSVVVVEPSLILFTHNVHVDGWIVIQPGSCEQVYADSQTGNFHVAQEAYIGFGFRDAQGRFVAGTVDSVPDFGRVFIAKILTKSDKKFCVSNNRVFYNINDPAFYHTQDPAETNCAAFHPGGAGDVGNDGPFFSFAAALYFQPVTGACLGQFNGCQDADYVLDVAPGAKDRDGNLHASVGSSPNPSGGDAGPDLGAILRAAAAAAAAAAAEDRKQSEEIRASDAVQAKAQAQAAVKQNICLSDDLTTEWRNPPPGGKMDKLKRQLIASLRDRAAHPGGYDQTKWFTVDSTYYPGWDPDTYFKGVVSTQPPGSCGTGKHLEILPLTP